MSHRIRIYHNPNCGTSRNTLGLIRNTGQEPEVIEYLKQPPTRAELIAMIEQAGLSVREAIRSNVEPYQQLDLAQDHWSDEQLLDAMLAHPILINRPFVMTARGVRLCRPSETVLEILEHPQQGAFFKEDGQQLIDAQGQLIQSSDKPAAS